MPKLRGITVAVGDWYARTLEICLIRNMRHLTECLVVTSPQDEAVQAVVAKVPGAKALVTDAFTRHGARFNKGLALEEGFAAMGRHGLILIHDADILLPDSIPFDRLKPDTIHGARRRILEDPSQWHPGFTWERCNPHRDGGPVGFFQLFDGDDPGLASKPYWYDPSFAHAGGGDAYFITHWPKHKQAILPIDVLHLGPADSHWFGCDEASKDMMARFVTDNGWSKAASKFTSEQVARAGVVVHRVVVPGYEPSTYELPFVARTIAARTPPALPTPPG